MTIGLASFACGTDYADPPAVSTSAGSGPASWVDEFIGTTKGNSPAPVADGAGGSTNPAAALPFGMVQWGPDTPSAEPAGYEWNDTQISGFSVTHLSGAGCNGLRDFPVYPISGAWDPSSDPLDTFSHASEHASPGFYEVSLGSGVKVDITATARTGLARFSFPHERPGRVVLAGARAHEVIVEGAHVGLAPGNVVFAQRKSGLFCGTPTGYTLHLAARFDRALSGFGGYDASGVTASAAEASGPGSGMYFDFDTSKDGAVQMKIGLSYVSDDAALANLDAEDPGWDFEAVHAAALATWNAALGRVAVEGGADDDARMFYTALYHVLLQPAVASDVDGQFMGFDDRVHTAVGYTRYQNFSGWDVYRSWVQLAAVIAPDQANDVLRSLVEAGAECGVMPKWALANREASTMVGDPAAAFVASGYAFGARKFDAGKALSMMVEAATNPAASCQGHVVRRGLASEMSRHYCAIDAPDAATGVVSTTLEYAASDFSIAQLAAALGDAPTHATFMDRAGWWKNTFDAARSANGFTGYLQPRRMVDVSGAPSFQETDVTTQEQLDPNGASGFIEGNATQYTLAVAHDVPGLIALLGGDAALVARLDPFVSQLNAGLTQPYLYIGNEPTFSVPWAYDFAGAPYKTQAVVRRVLREAFSVEPGGLPGNDDLGALSSWQAWAMLGLYPAIPGVAGLVLGSPTFPKVTITLAGGATLVILADGASPDAPYVQSVDFDGAPTTSTWLDWSAASKGGTLHFVLGTSPNVAWGAGPNDRPPVPK